MTDLDTQVAEKVMGWKPIIQWQGQPLADGWKGFWDGQWFRWVERPESDDEDDPPPILWRPTESIADAWLVVEKMRERGFNFRLHDHFHDMEAMFTLPRMITEDKHWARSTRDSMPEAICRAALAAMGEI